MGRPLQVLLFAVYTALSAAGVILLRSTLPGLVTAFRSGEGWLPQAWLPALGALMYGTSFLCWLAILASTPASRAYPVAVGLTLAAVTLAAVAVLGERLGPFQVAGIAMVFIGVVLISRPAG